MSLPDRRYELAGHLLADALQEAQASGEPPRAVLDRRARALGRDIGEAARTDDRDVLGALEAFGFEPRTAGGEIVMANCPFHGLAQQHTELVCGMNLCLLDGLLDGLAAPPDLRRRCREVTLRPP